MDTDTTHVEATPQDGGADEALAQMGYQSELPRNLSMLSVLGLYVPFPLSHSLTLFCLLLWFIQMCA